MKFNAFGPGLLEAEESFFHNLFLALIAGSEEPVSVPIQRADLLVCQLEPNSQAIHACISTCGIQ